MGQVSLYSLTLIDALDMLVIMGNNTEFQRVANLVIESLDFDDDINVSVFETNIRVVGGLLSAHLMSKRGGLELEPGWPCSGPLLRMAEDVARRLLPAFDTPTGMPYGTVNLKHGVPSGETTVTCTAGVGTFLVEFGALSKLTGDPIFEKVAMRAMNSLWKARSTIGLVGNHIDVSTGKWTALDSGIGGGVDSYFEYLVKGSVMFENTQLLDMYKSYQESVEKYLKRDDWYMWAHMTKGSISLPIFTSLDCYWPGIQAMIGDVDKAMKTVHNFHQVWKQYGFLPEFYNIVKNEAYNGREGYPLRPELVEAAMYLYEATKDPYLLEIGVDMLESIEQNTKTKCGYATVKDVTTHTLENRMESFFLAETTKYLYLLFDPDNFIHNTGDHGSIIDTPNGQCVIDTGSYVFNTEAHPIDTAALYCCSAEKEQDDLELEEFHDNLDLLALFDITENTGDVRGVKWSKSKNHNSDDIDMADLFNTGENVLKLDVNKGAGHQKVMSTRGEKFDVKQRKVTKIIMKSRTADGKVEKNVVEVKTEDLKDKEQLEVSNMKESKSESDEYKQRGMAATCDKDGNCEIKDDNDDDNYDDDFDEDHHESDIYKKDANDDESDDGDDDDSFDSDNDEDDDGDIKTMEENSHKTTPPQHIHIPPSPHDTKPTLTVIKQSTPSSEHLTQSVKQSNPKMVQTPKSDIKTSSDKFQEVLKMITGFTEDYLLSSSGNVKSLKVLYNKLKYYSLFHQPVHEKLMCNALPFYMRLSTMGETFLTD
ncbi:ER degradation-enhancing alpha-mannosidase-like protein 2 [Mactra antiquata]